jgi:hypothetical protein
MNTLETAIYSVKTTAEAYAEARAKMLAVVSGWPGFMSGVTFRSLENGGVFFDYYLWQSRAEALGAAERVKCEPQAQDFLNCIGELISYQHYEVGAGQPSFTGTGEGDVFEVAVGVIDKKQTEAFHTIKPQLLGLVHREPGLIEIASAEAECEDGIANIDVLRWRTMKDAGAAMDVIHQTPQCGAFMKTIKTDTHFDHMTKFA